MAIIHQGLAGQAAQDQQAQHGKMTTVQRVFLKAHSGK